MPLDLAMSLCLLLGEPKAHIPAHATTILPRLERLAIELEILDPRECPSFFQNVDELRVDIRSMRNRWQELKDAPPAHDSQMFPRRKALKEWCEFNRAYKEHLEQRIKIDGVNGWELRELVVETDRRYDLIDTARESHADYYYVSVRRKALQRLRETLGYSAYYAGHLPPPVPLDGFRRID